MRFCYFDIEVVLENRKIRKRKLYNQVVLWLYLNNFCLERRFFKYFSENYNRKEMLNLFLINKQLNR